MPVMRRGPPLASWQLRNRAAELQRLAARLFATAGCERNHGAKERDDGDLLGTHDNTSKLAVLTPRYSAH
jgi:hypothetical protein